jgi:hypothetical protein
MHCTVTSAEVTNISRHGFWLLLDNEELLLPFEQFPWFRSATVEQITQIERPSPEHLYWPGLDIDLAVASIRQPEAYPLVARPRAAFNWSNNLMVAYSEPPEHPFDQRSNHGHSCRRNVVLETRQSAKTITPLPNCCQ